MNPAYRYPRLTILLIGSLTIFFGRHARRSKINNRLEENVLQDEHLAHYSRFLDDFGNDRILIGAFTYGPFDKDLLESLFDLEEKIIATGTVESILSPLSILKETFGFEQRVQFQKWLESPRAVVNYERRIRALEALRGTIFSRRDENTIGMLFKVSSQVGDADSERITALKHMIEEHPVFKGSMTLTGVPDLMRAIYGYTTFSQKVFTPACVVLIGLVLLALYRSAFGILVPLATVLAPLAWTMGIFNLLGSSSNFITTMIPPLILGIGMTSCIHLVTTYFLRTRDIEDFSLPILLETVRDLIPPIVMCQVTTLFGFLTLATNGIGAIQQYGIYSALGLVFVLISVSLLIPCLIIALKTTRQRVTILQTAFSIFDPVAGFVIRRKGTIIAVSALITLVGLHGLTRLSLETSLLTYLPPDHRVSKDFRSIEDKMCGIIPVHLCIERQVSGLADSLLDPELCRRIANLESSLLSLPEVDSAVSYVDLVQDYDRAFSGEKDHIPLTAKEVDNYLDFYRPSSGDDEEDVDYDEDEDLDEEAALRIDLAREHERRVPPTGEKRVPPPGEKGALLPGATPEVQVAPSHVDRFLTRDLSRAHIALRVRHGTSADYDRAFLGIERLAREILPPTVTFHLTGRAYLWALTTEILVRNEIANFFLTLLIICVIISIQFKSVSVGIVCLFPNAIPLVILYGAMGYLNMALNTVTGMIACVAVGMAVDDTIHYIHAYREGIRSGSTCEQAVVEAMREKGSSMVFTTVVLMTGFGVLMLSNFQPTFQFGLLISMTLLMALGFDLLLTPSILLVVRPFPSGEGEVSGDGGPLGDSDPPEVNGEE